MAQNQSLIESSKLAEYIQNSLANSLNLKDRGVHQAGFYVLRLNYMPAVLVEAAFISNTNEEKLLKQPWFRKKVSKSICKGIVDFVSGYKKRIYGK
jgi:N-acetylmuramoyl-L-alanine amidase